MEIYDSFGTFDEKKLEFNLEVQLTDIVPDAYGITAYYDICNANRYAILAILQTRNGNDEDLSTYPKDYTFMVADVKLANLDQSYITEEDKDIFKIIKGDKINIIVHHGIGFDPLNNPDDALYITNYKAETYVYYPNGAKPGKGGKGILT